MNGSYTALNHTVYFVSSYLFVLVKYLPVALPQLRSNCHFTHDLIRAYMQTLNFRYHIYLLHKFNRSSSIYFTSLVAYRTFVSKTVGYRFLVNKMVYSYISVYACICQNTWKRLLAEVVWWENDIYLMLEKPLMKIVHACWYNMQVYRDKGPCQYKRLHSRAKKNTTPHVSFSK